MEKNIAFFRKARLFENLTIFLFIAATVWWLVLQFSTNENLGQHLNWAASYQIIALMGAIGGLVVAKSWGGFKSVMGKSIIFFSFGLLAQVFGQSTFSFYNLVTQVEIPYPSIADIGFFVSIIFYSYALVLLGRASGVRLSLQKSSGKKILAIIIPLILVIASYLFFLKGYSFDESSPLRIFLDFGYPLGDAVYVSLALTALFASRNFLGGIMRKPILLILLALVLQYVADFNFLYQASSGTWINGGYGDFLYACSYFATSISLVILGLTFQKVIES